MDGFGGESQIRRRSRRSPSDKICRVRRVRAIGFWRRPTVYLVYFVVKTLNQLLNVLHPVTDILNHILDIPHPFIDLLHLIPDTLYALANTNHPALDVVRNPQELQRRHVGLFQCQPVQPPKRIFDICISDQLPQIFFCRYVSRGSR